jgi:hypothetical protein
MFSGDLDRYYSVQTTQQDIHVFETALERFKGRTGRYPGQEDGLATLVGTELERLPVDPWGSRYSYSLDRIGKPIVYSKGAKRAHLQGDLPTRE